MKYFLDNHPSNRPHMDRISQHCQHSFSSLPRSDQRRWAEVCVRGLLTVPGRKTVKRISAQIVGGGAEQCLQQFVNQSTWRSDLIRRDVAMKLAEELNPAFWILEDTVIPKDGRYSVGVDKQFAHPEGRTLNCQLGLGLFFSGDDWSCPVNWRLPLPASWEKDAVRRSKAHVPAAERCKPRWQHMLDLIDEVAAEWMMPAQPVLGDLTPETEVERFLSGLEERYLSFAMKVSVNRSAASVPGISQPMTFGQIIAEAIRRKTTTVNGWQVSRGRSGLTRIVAVPLVSSLSRPTRQRYLVAEWSAVRDIPRSAWVTSFSPRDFLRLLEGAECFSRVRSNMRVLYEELGLRHFEGRSFVGWHHYATLVSVAAAYRLLSRQDDDLLEAPDPEWLFRVAEPRRESYVSPRPGRVLVGGAAHGLGRDLRDDVLGDRERRRRRGRRCVTDRCHRADPADPEVVDQGSVGIDCLSPDPSRRGHHVTWLQPGQVGPGLGEEGPP
jgi:SRSO17 transposase